MSHLIFQALITILICSGHFSSATVEQCAKNGVRKSAPSGNTEILEFCRPWQDRSCCRADTAKSVGLHGQIKIDGTSWDLCGNISENCRNFFKKETCFYECEPNLANFVVPWYGTKERYSGIPVCGKFCDDWYQACKDDLTCAKNWSRDFKWSRKGNRCRSGRPCKTYKDVYGSGKVLCENLWGSTFRYIDSEKDCFQVSFTGNVNPNRKVAEKLVNQAGK